MAGVPVPMVIEISPLALVVGVCVSANTGVPVAEPCRIVIFTPTGWLVTRALVLLRTTA